MCRNTTDTFRVHNRWMKNVTFWMMCVKDGEVLASLLCGDGWLSSTAILHSVSQTRETKLTSVYEHSLMDFAFACSGHRQNSAAAVEGPISSPTSTMQSAELLEVSLISCFQSLVLQPLQNNFYLNILSSRSLRWVLSVGHKFQPFEFLFCEGWSFRVWPNSVSTVRIA